jgi:hypothetical protein
MGSAQRTVAGAKSLQHLANIVHLEDVVVIQPHDDVRHD